MAFIILCVDKEDPKLSELVTVEPTEKQIVDDEDPTDIQIFPTKPNAERWIDADEKEFVGTYDYHIIQVG